MVALVIQVQELAPVGKDCLPGADHAVEQGHVFSRSTGLQFCRISAFDSAASLALLRASRTSASESSSSMLCEELVTRLELS